MSCCSCFQEDVEHSKCMSQTRQEVLAAEQAEVDINALRPDTGAKRGFIVGWKYATCIAKQILAKHRMHFCKCIISSQACHVLGIAMMNVYSLFHGNS